MIILILLFLILICLNIPKKSESYVSVDSNKKNIPKKIYKYQKKNLSNEYGFIPRSIYPDIVKLNNNHSKKLIKDFKNNGGDSIFNNIEKDGGCRYFHLIKDGRIQRFSERFPIIMKYILRIPNLKYASISCLDPNTETEVHNKFDRSMYRAHIPLQVPKGNCGICVEKECRTWEERDFLLIDENLMHQVWNYTNERRVVLLLDVEKVNFKKN